MIHVHQLAAQTQEISASIPPQSWAHVVSPTDEELSRLNDPGIPPDFLAHASVVNERSSCSGMTFFR